MKAARCMSSGGWKKKKFQSRLPPLSRSAVLLSAQFSLKNVHMSKEVLLKKATDRGHFIFLSVQAYSSGGIKC